MFIEESLYEFAKRDKKPIKKTRKPRFTHINSTDDWVKPDDVEDFDDIDNIDISDMTNVPEIDVEEDLYDDELFNALNNELKVPEFNRRLVKFRLKGNLKRILHGIPMAKIGENVFLFKLEDGSMKKIALKDVILEQIKIKNNRAKTINEYRKYEELYDGEAPDYILTDGREVTMIEDYMKGMAGEPIVIYYFIDKETEEELWFKDIKDFLEPGDRKEIGKILLDAGETNEESAINWVK
jgi:hypothetical protein